MIGPAGAHFVKSSRAPGHSTERQSVRRQSAGSRVGVAATAALGGTGTQGICKADLESTGDMHRDLGNILENYLGPDIWY